MTDPRLLEWLAVTEKAISAEPERRIEAVGAACAQRDELQRSLLEKPPSEAPDPETVERLRRAEEALLETASSERTRVREALDKVRAQKRGTRGYRPARSSDAVFVSRKA